MQAIEPIFATKTPDEFRQALISFSESLDFPTCDVTAFIKRKDSEIEDMIYVTHLPNADEWQSLPPGLGARCPVMQHCKVSTAPISWGAATYAHDDIRDIYDIVSSLGLRAGVCQALHLPGICFQVSLHTDRHVAPRHHRFFSQQLSLFASAAMAAASQVLFKVDADLNTQQLTLIELDALRWIGDGLSVESTAAKLNLSVSDAMHIIDLATRTLGCHDMHGAAATIRRRTMM